jgi:urea transport system ATP-binding protein
MVEERAPESGARFLEVEGVTKLFGGVRAVDGVDMRLGENEMRCVIGPNGCGKTTLFNLITGYHAPDGGTIRFEGKDIPGRPLHEIARSGIVRKFQVPSVFPALSVTDNVESAFAARRRGAPPPAPDALDRLLATTQLDRHRDKEAGTLSHGQKQWLELALVLATDPRLILLDEPAAGMTKAEKGETVRLIETIRKETAVSVLVIEHDMDFVEALASPVSVMMMGRIVASGSFDEVRREKTVREAYLGPVKG